MNKESESDFEDSEDELCFVKALDEEEMSDIFAPPKDPKSLLLPEKRAPCNNRLPDDSLYQPESLVKLFLLPHINCFGKREKKDSFWDGENICGGQNGGGNVHGDVDDSKILVSQFCQKGVQKFSITANKNLPWRKVLEFGHHVFNETRTPVDLKDKWKNIMAKQSNH